MDDRLQANNRFYCDQDPMDPSSLSNTRWKLIGAAQSVPGEYVIQQERPRYYPTERTQPHSQWQEWEDRGNSM